MVAITYNSFICATYMRIANQNKLIKAHLIQITMNKKDKTEAQMLREYFNIRNTRLKLIAAELRDSIYMLDISQVKAKKLFTIAQEIEKEAGNE